jgi:drug/metabolite transporter (DMT)-like permease
MQNQRLKGYLAAGVSAVSFGLIPVFIVPVKQEGISMDVTLFYRFFLGALMIAVYMLLRGQSLKIQLPDIPKLMIMGVFYALSSEFLFQGYDLMSVGIASTVIYTYPILVALILSIGFGERISGLTKLSIVMATLGVAAMSWEGDALTFNATGLIVVLLGALAYALYMVMVNKSNLQVKGIRLTCYSLFFSAMFYAAKSTIVGETLLLPSPYWVGFIASFSLVTTVLSVLTMVIAIQWIGSTPTAVLGALEPVVAVAIAVILFGERITWNLVIGVVFVIAALVITVLGKQIKKSADYRGAS